MNALERAAAKLAWRLLVHRGWVVRLNTPARCRNMGGFENRSNFGWEPLHAIRYGTMPVYRGPGEVPWSPGVALMEEGIAAMEKRKSCNHGLVIGQTCAECGAGVET